MELSIKTKEAIVKADQRINKIYGWETNEIQSKVNCLKEFGTVEVGWRESCGTCDNTQKVYREWVRLIKRIRKDGIKINEERKSFKNSYATLSGGFWQSVIYSLNKAEIVATKAE